MNEPATQQRRRYSPDVRRSMLLDAAADIICREGVAGLSLERVGQAAGVSKSLVYKYFNSILDLMKELLARELKALRRRQMEAAEQANTLEELVRNITHVYLCYIEERGLIIERLQAEPRVSETQDPTDFGRSGAVDYLAAIIARHFDMPQGLARAATDVSFGLPSAAGHYLLSHDMPREELEDLTVSMILGSITMFHGDYLLRKQKLRR
ncbi:MAG: TetR family transcriptional regulator [Halioglobus sp.]|nr:TetR family transcriptional regulator [Halioglobus sp.]